ncbi:MAG: DNA repair protein RecO [Acidobacteriota bacterium]
MQLHDSVAFVLDVVDLGEKDRIVTWLSPEHGRKRGVAKSARTKFSKFAGQLQPLAKIDVRWAEKPGRELVRIRDASLLRPVSGLDDLEGLLIGAYLAEHFSQFAQEDDPSEALFRLLDSTLAALAEGTPRSLAARYVEVWVLRLQGLLPPPVECPLCGRPLGDRAAFLEDETAIVCPECADGYRSTPVDGATLDFLRRSARENLKSLESRPPTVGALRRVEAIARRIRRLFLETELRSYRVMRETLSDV